MDSDSDFFEDVPLGDRRKRKRETTTAPTIKAEDDEDSDFEDVPIAKRRNTPVKKKAHRKTTAAKGRKKKGEKKKTSQNGRVKRKKEVVDESQSAAGVKPFKALTKLEKIELAMRAYKWWENEDEVEEGEQWRELEHNGVRFAPEYEKHHVKMLYDGVPVELSREQEEIATYYASMPVDGPQLGDKQMAPIFQKNFFKDFKVSRAAKTKHAHFAYRQP